MIISPLQGILLIKADKPKTQSDAGILLNEQWKTLPLEGTVLEVGDGIDAVKKGDRVGFNRYASIILENDERLINERQLLWLRKN